MSGNEATKILCIACLAGRLFHVSPFVCFFFRQCQSNRAECRETLLQEKVERNVRTQLRSQNGFTVAMMVYMSRTRKQILGDPRATSREVTMLKSGGIG